MYLLVNEKCETPYRTLISNPKKYPNYWAVFCWYPIPSDGYALLKSLDDAGMFDRQAISGILADYLDENRSLLLDGATGPSDPAVRLDRLIHYLRQRCVSPSGV